ncbi:MAG: FMN-binding negative transcriptional regulator [Planctomycetaceae bacterium]|nr:FMN-binding negative transcriptional regulator [Planctomycetaceae bacterium]
MYTPPHFAETDPATLHRFMEQHSFATLVSLDGEGVPQASHLPLLLDRDRGEQGELIGHWARANPQAERKDGETVIAIFHGPHAYISPTWYQTTNVVPTWNYVAVHVTGTVSVDDSLDARRDCVRRTVDYYESTRPQPWSLDTPDPEFVDRLLNAIVCFRIRIQRIEGKWKLSQNHDLERRSRVIAALREEKREDAHQIAALMQQIGGETG